MKRLTIFIIIILISATAFAKNPVPPQPQPTPGQKAKMKQSPTLNKKLPPSASLPDLVVSFFSKMGSVEKASNGGYIVPAQLKVKNNSNLAKAGPFAIGVSASIDMGHPVAISGLVMLGGASPKTTSNTKISVQGLLPNQEKNNQIQCGLSQKQPSRI